MDVIVGAPQARRFRAHISAHTYEPLSRTRFNYSERAGWVAAAATAAPGEEELCVGECQAQPARFTVTNKGSVKTIKLQPYYRSPPAHPAHASVRYYWRLHHSSQFAKPLEVAMQEGCKVNVQQRHLSHEFLVALGQTAFTSPNFEGKKQGKNCIKLKWRKCTWGIFK